MKIKYHQWNIDNNEYGADHALTDNWNPEKDYGNEYVKVYFNINTPAFDIDGYFETDEDRDIWYEKINSLLNNLGIEENSGYYAEGAYLCTHPQSISGIILKNDVKKVAEAINKTELSTIRWVDLHDTVYDISDEEYEEYLTAKDDEIRKFLYENCTTPRVFKYYYTNDICGKLAQKYRLYRLGKSINADEQAMRHIQKIIEQMAQDGLLKTPYEGNMRMFRSLNKTERKTIKVNF